MQEKKLKINLMLRSEISEMMKQTQKIENKPTQNIMDTKNTKNISIEKSEKHLNVLPSLSQDGRDENEVKVMDTQLLASIQKPSFTERSDFKSKKLKSAIYEINDFNTLFNSFAENEFDNIGKRQARKTLCK